MAAIEFNRETEFILGRPNFWCGRIAMLMRDKGHEINGKSEAEQAYVIHWMLGLYGKHGDDWRKEFDKYFSNG